MHKPLIRRKFEAVTQVGVISQSILQMYFYNGISPHPPHVGKKNPKKLCVKHKPVPEPLDERHENLKVDQIVDGWQIGVGGGSKSR